MVARRHFKIYLFITTVLFLHFYVGTQFIVVKGGSMAPTFKNGTTLIFVSWTTNCSERGDIAIVNVPGCKRLCKRIIGMPRDVVRFDGIRIFVNNIFLEESYIENCDYYGQTTITLKDNEVFVLGDNRSDSHDSRDFGPVDIKHVTSIKYFFTIWRF